MIVTKLNLHIPEAMLAIADATEAGLQAIGITLEGQARHNITTMRAVKSGRLRASITFKTKNYQSNSGYYDKEDIIKSEPKKNVVYIGTNVKYAPFIEYGTIKMKERPYLRVAFDQWKNKLNDIFAASYKKVMDSKK